MSKLSHKLRITVLRGMEALGTSAANLASNAKLRVNELNLETRRREILTDFSLQAFELWQKGVQLPEPLSDMLRELCDIESRLNVLRAQKYAKVTGDAGAKQGGEAAPACPVSGGAAEAQAALDASAAETDRAAADAPDGEPATAQTNAAEEAATEAGESKPADGSTEHEPPQG